MSILGSNDSRSEYWNGRFPRRPGLSSFRLEDYIDHMAVATISTVLEEDRAEFLFRDWGGADYFKGEATGVELPEGTAYGYVDGGLGRCSANGCVHVTCQTESKPISKFLCGYTAVLTGFELGYTYKERNIKEANAQVETYSSGGKCYVRARACLADLNGDDPYTFKAYYALVPPRYVEATGTSGTKPDSGGSSVGYDHFACGVEPCTGKPVLTGFRFRNTESTWIFQHDMALKFIAAGVSLENENVGLKYSVGFTDKDMNKDYVWTVDYAVIMA